MMNINFLLQYTIECWLCFGIILIILEIICGWPTIALFFSGLACINVAMALIFNLVSKTNIIEQCIIFLGCTLVWLICFWRPAKKLLQQNNKNTYHNIIGTTAIVHQVDLKKGEIGEIKWSGTICKAMIIENNLDIIPANSLVTITETQGNIFIVKKA